MTKAFVTAILFAITVYGFYAHYQNVRDIMREGQDLADKTLEEAKGKIEGLVK